MSKQLMSIIFVCFLASCAPEDDNNQQSMDDNEIQEEQFDCTQSLDPAISLQLFDSATGEVISACNSIVTVTDGSFEEVFEGDDNCESTENKLPLNFASEREGTYDLEVIKDEFDSYYQYNIAVTTNSCHVNTIKLDIFLTKL